MNAEDKIKSHIGKYGEIKYIYFQESESKTACLIHDLDLFVKGCYLSMNGLGEEYGIIAGQADEQYEYKEIYDCVYDNYIGYDEDDGCYLKYIPSGMFDVPQIIFLQLCCAAFSKNGKKEIEPCVKNFINICYRCEQKENLSAGDTEQMLEQIEKSHICEIYYDCYRDIVFGQLMIRLYIRKERDYLNNYRNLFTQNDGNGGAFHEGTQERNEEI